MSSSVLSCSGAMEASLHIVCCLTRTRVLTQALLLTSWVRNGFYLEPLAQQHICIQHVQYAEDQASSSTHCAVSSCSMPACCRNWPDAHVC